MHMSNKDKIIQLLNHVPEYKMGYVLAYIQGITADEETDEQYCEEMAEAYLKEKNHEAIPFEQAIQEAGLSLDDI